MNGQFPMFGGCPELDTVQNFNLTAYMGDWYELEKYFSMNNIGSRCVKESYSLRDNSSIGVVHSEIGSITSRLYIYDGYGAFLNDKKSGKFIIKYPAHITLFGQPYYILDTDYKNFSVVWSCSNYGVIHRGSVWIYTRSKTPSAKVLKRAYDVLTKNKLSKLFLRRTVHLKCLL